MTVLGDRIDKWTGLRDGLALLKIDSPLPSI